MNIYISSELWTEKCVLMLSLSICFRFDFVGCQRLVCLSRLVSGLKSAIISVFNHRLRETIRYNFDSSLFAIKLCCQNFLNVPLWWSIVRKLLVSVIIAHLSLAA